MFEQAVQAGIQVLEEKGLNWRAAALNPRLDMAWGDVCILGFLQGDYATTQRKWGVTDDWMERHGFFVTEATLAVSDMNFTEACLELAEAWRNAAQSTDLIEATG
jgi:hypothetical protein